MSITSPIDEVYPNVRPLALALIETAAERGATAEEFDMACERIKAMVRKKSSGILLSEIQGDI